METTWSAEGDPRLAAIRRAVQVVLRQGLRPAKLAMAPEVFVLAEPLLEPTATPLEKAFAVEERCREVLERFGDGPAGRTLQLLLGAASETRSLPLKTRRQLAAEEWGVFPSTFRKLYEGELLEDLVVELRR